MYDNDILYEIKEIDMLIVRKILSDAKKNKDLPFSPIQGKIINYLVEKKLAQKGICICGKRILRIMSLA